MPTGAAAPTPVPATDPPVSSPTAKTSYLPETTDPLLGQTLAGRYQIVRKLGEGGMGAVYLARHELLEKEVALKVLHGEFARKPDLVERFIQEAKAASRIRHENVIDISDFGKTPEGLVFFAMELLQGHDLHDEIARARIAGQLLPWARSKKIFLQICSALFAAHAQGIVHRDLKPENVYLVDFLGDPDFVKLLDFGIAKLTEVDEGGRKLTKTGMLFGTPEYMSPEQARGEQVDHRVDVYAMGCILFQLVTGRVPFEAENFMGVLSLHLTEPAPSIPPAVFDRIGAPRELAGVIERALLKDRTQRWQTIEELSNAVRMVCGDPPASGMTGHIPAQRPASVPAPAETMTRQTPVTGHGQVAPTTGTHGRVRTQWTGNLSVPQADDGDGKPRSKLPLILGGVLVAGAAAVAAVVVMSGNKSPSGEGSGVASGSNIAVTAPADAQVAIATPDAPAAPVLPPPPEWSEITIESTPRGATVVDLTTNTRLGTTPKKFKVRGSHTPRKFSIALARYGEIVVELVPNEPTIKHTEKLVKGASTMTVTRPIDKPGDGSAIVKPSDVGSAAKPTIEKPGDGSATKPPDPVKPPDDECPGDEPCLKTNVPGLRGSDGSGSTP